MYRFSLIKAKIEEGGQFDLLINQDDSTEYAVNFREKWWIETSLNFILKYYPRGSKLIDLGANIGVFSMSAAAAGLQCLSIEAYPPNFITLHEAVRANGFKNIRLVNAAVSDRIGFVAMGLSGAYARINPDGTGMQVPAFPADNIIEVEDFLDGDIVKIDIEGAELLALKGMKSFFDKNNKVSVLYESNPDACSRLGYDYREIMRFFEDRGFNLYFVRSERIYQTSSRTVQPWAVADIFATRSDVPEIAPFEHADLTSDIILDGLILDAKSPHQFVRDHAKSEISFLAEEITLNDKYRILTDIILSNNSN